MPHGKNSSTGGAPRKRALLVLLWNLVAIYLECAKERARHIPSQTDPAVGLFRNMSCSSCVCAIWVIKNATRAPSLIAYLNDGLLVSCIDWFWCPTERTHPQGWAPRKRASLVLLWIFVGLVYVAKETSNIFHRKLIQWLGLLWNMLLVFSVVWFS